MKYERELLLVKLGGSAITFKHKNRREAKKDCIRYAARQIQRAQKERSFSLIVVHGAGPFGHALVAEYGIRDGVRDSRQVEGLIRTHRSVQELCTIVCDIFNEEGLRCFPIQPSACVIQSDKEIESFFTEAIEGMLAVDPELIPVLYGDMVVDRSLGASVVSGDALVSYLARHLEASRVLMGTDVPGVFDGNPRDPASRLIDIINKSNLDRSLASVGVSEAIDVTSGMRGKLEQLVLLGKPTLIFDLNETDALFRALLGKKVRGTEIQL
jgi:isopentenyl phosphate kinase